MRPYTSRPYTFGFSVINHRFYCGGDPPKVPPPPPPPQVARSPDAVTVRNGVDQNNIATGGGDKQTTLLSGGAGDKNTSLTRKTLLGQ